MTPADNRWRRLAAAVAFGLLTVARTRQATTQDTVNEYCEGETFSAHCARDEILILISAQYGRMRLGHCLTQDFGRRRCRLDILPLLDDRCSGRRHCDVRVSSLIDATAAHAQSCSKDLRNYLEASFRCVKVVTARTTECLSARGTPVPTGSGYLASLITDETECGSYDTPWLLSSGPGQHIVITLFDFGIAARRRAAPTKSCQQVYAVIKEIGVGNSKTICGNDRRQSDVYTSGGNDVEIRTVLNRNAEGKVYFVLHYKTVGCLDPLAPPGGWVRRLQNIAMLGCNNSATKWRLTCEGDSWRGRGENCTLGAAIASRKTILGILTGSQWASILIVLSIAVSLGILIFLIGLVYLRRKRSRQERQRSSIRDRYAAPDYCAGHQPEVGSGDYAVHKTPSNLESYTSSENDYYRTWQMQRHVGAPKSRGIPVGPPSVPYDVTERPEGDVPEHIYESPKFDRRDDVRCAGGSQSTPTLQYFELERQDELGADESGRFQ